MNTNMDQGHNEDIDIKVHHLNTSKVCDSAGRNSALFLFSLSLYRRKGASLGRKKLGCSIRSLHMRHTKNSWRGDRERERAKHLQLQIRRRRRVAQRRLRVSKEGRKEKCQGRTNFRRNLCHLHNIDMSLLT